MRENGPSRPYEPSAGVVEDVVDFGFAEARVDGDGDGSGELDAEEGDAPVEAVGEADGDAAAGLVSWARRPPARWAARSQSWA